MKTPRPDLAAVAALASFFLGCGGDNNEARAKAQDPVGDDDASTSGEISLTEGSNDGAGSGGVGSEVHDGGLVQLSPDEVTAIANASCTGWAAEGENIPAVLQFVVDVSGSMNQPAPGANGRSKWEVTHEALEAAIDDLPGTVAVGLLHYPNFYGDYEALSQDPKDIRECIDVDEAVGIALLGDEDSPQRQKISTALNEALADFMTPTHDAYKHALDEHLIPYPSIARKFMVLLTDGAPTMLAGCVADGDNITDVDTDPVVQEVARARDDHGILSFIIGAPGSEESYETMTDKRPWLSKAAEVGGTSSGGQCSTDGPEYCHMDMTQDADFAATLSNGLATIAGQVIDSCTFGIPEAPTGEIIDPDKTHVIMNRGDGTVVLVLPDRVGDCDEGWLFDADGNIELCPKTCNDIKLDPKASIELTFGCGIDQVLPVR